jgi:predicted lipid-binding transport protein (Tim44 family)
VAGDAHPEDREWTHDPLERSFFSTVGRGYLVGIVVFGLFGFLVARTQAPDWGTGAAIGAALFVAVFVGILGGVVLIGLWAMKNEELIRGNETGHAAPVDVAQDAEPADAEPVAGDPADAADAPGVADVLGTEPSEEPADEAPAATSAARPTGAPEEPAAG